MPDRSPKPDRWESEDPRDDERLKAAMRARGWLKVALVTIAINEVFTMIFGYVAQTSDPDLTIGMSIVFSCVTCLLVSYWLQIDARRAWRNARDKGYLRHRRTTDDDSFPQVADNCPRRWLVVLHIELHPELARIS